MALGLGNLMSLFGFGSGLMNSGISNANVANSMNQANQVQTVGNVGVDNVEFNNTPSGLGLTNGVTGAGFGTNVVAPTDIGAKTIDATGVTGSNNGIFTGDNLMKGLALGSSIWNDYENRKVQKGIANHNIRKDKNARARAQSLQNSIGGGKGKKLSGQDYKEI